MANRRNIPRWSQFGILDLLILTAIAAVAAFLWRPAQGKTHTAPPWIVGAWLGPGKPWFREFLPDGCYQGFDELDEFTTMEWRYSWTLKPHDTLQEAFVLSYGEERWIIRSEWGSGVMDVFNEDGSVKFQFEQVGYWEGEWRDGAPDGIWQGFVVENRAQSGEYRHGELVDLRDRDGKRELKSLNSIRKARGLAELTEHDFVDDSTSGDRRR